jgi:ribosomal-protein-alanine N-acetyltransferase
MTTGLGSAASARPSAFDPRVVHLRLADDSVVPEPSELHRWIERIGSDGSVRSIRTSALFPRTATRFREVGFSVADTLALLRADLADADVRGQLVRTPAEATTRPLRRRDYPAAAGVDRRAFGSAWGHDAAELEQIRNATPHWRGRVRADANGRAPIVAFAISGASADHGYLQRLSVDPAEQRCGHGRSLTLDSLRWMTRRRLADCLVNTSVTNTAALALYQSIGFRLLNGQLEVLELDVERAS